MVGGGGVVAGGVGGSVAHHRRRAKLFAGHAGKLGMKGRWAEAACPAQLRASDTVCPSHVGESCSHEGGVV